MNTDTHVPGFRAGVTLFLEGQASRGPPCPGWWTARSLLWNLLSWELVGRRGRRHCAWAHQRRGPLFPAEQCGFPARVMAGDEGVCLGLIQAVLKTQELHQLFRASPELVAVEILLVSLRLKEAAPQSA